MSRHFILFVTVWLTFSTISCSTSSSGRVNGKSLTVPEEIGMYLSELLIQRGNISETPLTFTLEELLGEHTLADFQDSPGMLILQMLYGQQVLAQKSWDNLLFQADNLGINSKVTPEKTYFIQREPEEFSLLCILAPPTSYHCFTATIRMKDENSWYVSNIGKEINTYANWEEVKKEWLSMEKMMPHFFMKEPDDEIIETRINQEAYSYNTKVNLPKLTNPSLPSFDPLIQDITKEIQTGKNREVANLWEVDSKQKTIKSIHTISSLTNIPLHGSEGYDARITFFLTIEESDEVYSFSYDINLSKQEWIIYDISPIESIKEDNFEFFRF